MTFDEIKNRFDNLKTNPQQKVHIKIKGVIIGLLDKQCGSKENRYQLAIALGCAAHSKDWTDGEWYAMSQIVKPDKPIDKWVATEPKFESVVGTIMAKIGNNELQQSLFEVA